MNIRRACWFAFLALCSIPAILSISGCGGSKAIPRGFDTPIVPFNPTLAGALPPSDLLLQAVALGNPPGTFAAADGFPMPLAGMTGTITVNSNGLTLGAAGGTEPQSVDPVNVADPIVQDNPFTPKPPTISNRNNVDFRVTLNAVPGGALNSAAPDAEANNPFYWARVTPCPAEPPVADNRPFRCNNVMGGVLQIWMMARVQPPFTTTPPPVGERQQLTLFYRRRAEGANIAGSLRGFSNPAGAPPGGVQPDDVVVRFPGTWPAVGAAPHLLAGTALLPPLRVIGLPPIPATRIVGGVVDFRFFILDKRVLDAAHTGGFEIAVAPRNILATPPGQPDFQLVLLRAAVPSVESLLVRDYLQGINDFGLAMSLEPAGEETIDLVLRNPIDVAVFRPTTALMIPPPAG